MARWPDDARGGPYDHPDWHYSEKIQSSMRHLLPFAWGHARSAPAEQRAIALCWVLNIVGDMHEPEHAGLWMNGRFPLTDQAGNTAWVRTSPAMRPEKLHWLWDSAGAVDPDEGRRRDPDAFAAHLEAQHPDPGVAPPSDPLRAYDSWVDESRHLSRHVAYQDGSVPLGASAAAAALLAPTYVSQVRTVAEDRLAIAGYRTAGLLQGLR